MISSGTRCPSTLSGPRWPRGRRLGWRRNEILGIGALVTTMVLLSLGFLLVLVHSYLCPLSYKIPLARHLLVAPPDLESILSISKSQVVIHLWHHFLTAVTVWFAHFFFLRPRGDP